MTGQRRTRLTCMRKTACEPLLCHAILLEETGNEQAAAWRAVNAAWACDDEGAGEAAARARLRAVELFRLEIAEGGEFGDEGQLEDTFASESAMLAELLRRAGRFEDAIQECGEGLESVLDERLRRLLVLQRSLAEQRDDRLHSCEGLDA